MPATKAAKLVPITDPTLAEQDRCTQCGQPASVVIAFDSSGVEVLMCSVHFEATKEAVDVLGGRVVA